MPSTCIGLVIGSTSISAFFRGTRKGRKESMKLPKKLPLTTP